LVLDFMLLWDGNRQQLWDKVAGTTVIGDTGVAEHDVMSGGAQSLSLLPA
jgi:hypothetical protein